MRRYLDVVDRYSRMARDPSAAGIAAVVSAADLLKPRGTDAAINYFNELLPQVKDPAVERAIRIQLAELYKTSGQQDQALEQLRTLMTSDSGAEPEVIDSPPPPAPQDDDEQ